MQRTFRIPERLYRDAQYVARMRRETVSDVIRRCLEAYVENDNQGSEGA